MRYVFPDAVLNQHLVILGKTGSGKSSALRYIVERLLTNGKRVCIVDPKGDWWGLKVASDGKGPGFPVILFGDFKNAEAKDVPINDRSGRHLAELVSGGNRPCIVGLAGWTQGSMTRLWIDFASTLFGQNRGELYLVVDEFHNFAPKGKILSPDAGQSLHWSNRLLSEGRGLGIVCLTASQRPQKVHNDSLTSHETLVAMRVIHKADRDAVKDWIDGNGEPELGKEVLNTLAGMPRGDAWFWSPEIKFGPKRLTFPMFETFDSFAPPQLQKRVSEKGWAGVDLSEVKAALAEAVKEAEANDPKLLKREIADLKKQLSSKPAAAPADPKTIERAVSSAIAARDREWQKAIKERDGIIGDFKGRIEKAVKILHVNGETLPSQAGPSPQNIQGETRGSGSVTAPSPTPKAGVLTNASTHRAKSPEAAPAYNPGSRASADRIGDLPRGEAAILSALIQFPDGLQRTQLTVLTGYKRSSRDAYIQRLREKGYVESSGDSVQATEDGIAALPDAEPLPTGQELREYWLRRLPEGERAILEQLIEAYPEAVEREALDEATGYKRSSRDAYLQRMRAKQLIEEPSRGEVRASENLF